MVLIFGGDDQQQQQQQKQQQQQQKQQQQKQQQQKQQQQKQNTQKQSNDSSEMSYDQMFKFMNIPKTATVNEIERAYRRMAKEAHPDKGGTSESFVKLQKIYEKLKSYAKL